MAKYGFYAKLGNSATCEPYSSTLKLSNATFDKSAE